MSERMSTRSSGTCATPIFVERGAPKIPVSALPRVSALNIVVLPLEGRPIMPIFINSGAYFSWIVSVIEKLWLIQMFNRTASCIQLRN